MKRGDHSSGVVAVTVRHKGLEKSLSLSLSIVVIPEQG